MPSARARHVVVYSVIILSSKRPVINHCGPPVLWDRVRDGRTTVVSLKGRVEKRVEFSCP